MKIALATTQSLHGSTLTGRVLPLAQELQNLGYEVTALVLGDCVSEHEGVSCISVGHEPFKHTSSGKIRLHGLRLIINMKLTALRTAWTLWRLKPDVVVIVKTLPHNVAGVWLWRHILRGRGRIILDADDFELAANQLSSLMQRAAVHWAERAAVKLAAQVVVASPFLGDHFKQLGAANITLIPTGLTWGEPAKSSNNAILAYVGSVSKSSGHRVELLPAILAVVLKEQPDAKLLMIGGGDDIDDLKAKFAALNLTEHVEWHGRFALNELSSLISNVGIIIDPIDDSVVQRAKSSFRVMLAAASGRAVVTANIGIRPALLSPEFHERFFAKPNNPTSFAEKILALINRPLTNVEKTALITFAKQYHWDNLAKQYDAIIRR